VIEGLKIALGDFQGGAHADDTAALVLRRAAGLRADPAEGAAVGLARTGNGSWVTTD
jgi:hypothetical protein